MIESCAQLVWSNPAISDSNITITVARNLALVASDNGVWADITVKWRSSTVGVTVFVDHVVLSHIRHVYKSSVYIKESQCSMSDTDGMFKMDFNYDERQMNYTCEIQVVPLRFDSHPLVQLSVGALRVARSDWQSFICTLLAELE